MIHFFPGLKRRKAETTLLIDVGTETVKALLFEEGSREIKILGSSLEYFDRYGIFDSRDFETDVLKKAISRAIQNLGGEMNKSVALGLPAHILKARVIRQSLKREEPKKIIGEKEEKEIFQDVLEKAKKRICQIYSQQSGILPGDIQFINLKILEMKIDGYRVPAIRKYQGKILDLRILAVFLPSHYLKKIKDIFVSLGITIKAVIQSAQGLNFYIIENKFSFLNFSNQVSIPKFFKFRNGESEMKNKFSFRNFLNSEMKNKFSFRNFLNSEMKNVDKIFLDIGGTITQVFLVKGGMLEKIDEFSLGGQIFSKAISEKLGLRETEARILKERYSKKELSEESSERIKEIIWFPSQIWFRNLKLKLKEMTAGHSLPLNIILFGGGSQLPDVQDILKNGDWESISSSGKFKVQIFCPEEKNPERIKICLPADLSTEALAKVEALAKAGNSPQEIPLLLMSYAQ